MRARISAVTGIVCLMAIIGIAQERGRLVVKVADPAGAALVGVTVTLTGPDTRKAMTDSRGGAEFAGLLPGGYTVRVELSGFRTIETRATIAAGTRRDLALVMKVGAGQESLDIRADSPVRVGGRIGAGVAGGIAGGIAEGVAGAPPPPAPTGVPATPVYRETPAIQRWERDRYRHAEKYDDPGDNPFRTVSADPLSTLSIDVDTASYANVRRFLNEGTLPPEEAVRIEEMINYFKFEYPQPKGDQPFSITTELADCPWNNRHRLALVGLQGRRIDQDRTPVRNLVFLLDVSGSMQTPDKLPLVKHGMRMLAGGLTARDRVAIVVYAGASGVVLDSTPGDQREKINRAMESLHAGGSTNGGAGIKLAYRLAREHFVKGGVNRVILATDGDFNVGVTDRRELERLIERERESGVFLSVLGVGTGNINDALMETLADRGNGNYAYLDSMHEAHRVLVKEAGSTLVTIAKDVKIQVEFNPKAVGAYRLIGYENRILRDQDFNDDRKDAGEIGAGHSVTAIYEIVPAGVDLARPRVDPLKYSPAPPPEPARAPASKYDDELLTVKLRYKAPDGEVSRLTSAVIANRVQPMTVNLGFASAVAEAGMLLRGSGHVGGGSYPSAIARARKFRGDDVDGYRGEFARLMELAATLSKRDRTTR